MSDITDKRPEKLASAIYLITSFLNDQEPLKWKLRSLASEFLSLAKNVGLISAENNDLMQAEFAKYVGALDYSVSIPDFLKVESPRSEIKKLGEGPVLKDKSLKEFGAVSVKKNSRQNIIIAILKRKKEVMIKDVSPLISGCSEKTIQRELSARVQAGILRKVGEKRWSRYSLA